VSFHDGELLVQEQAGVLSDARRVGQMLRAAISVGAGTFLAERRLIVLAAKGADALVWVTALSGPPEFLQRSDDGSELRISASPARTDPVSAALGPGASVGLVAIDFAARRRFRVNGTLESVGSELVISVREAYGNCPKYIHAYRPLPDGESQDPTPLTNDQLQDRQRRWIERSEFFFLGTVHPEAGADASHRGGHPGFVRVVGSRELIWGDYPGNKLFNSLGNVAVHPAAGLLFIDPENGSTLQLTGKMDIDWTPESAAAIPAAERVLRFSIARVVETPGALSLRWAVGESSPFNPPAR
jgi:predicted pyridoxine 5'-phosphate oxidase superfamily flavin-nucleotide-binding protein